MTARDLTAIVSSRICHDLVSPVGAISNGVELLAHGSSKSSPELELISDSVDAATSKLRFFRIAFGAASDSQRIKPSDLREALAGGLGRTRAELEMITPDVGRTNAKAFFLALLCIETCIPLGGTALIRQVPGGYRIVATGRRTRDPEELWKVMAREVEATSVQPSEVQFALLGELLVEIGARFNWEIADAEARFELAGLPN